MSVLSCAKLTLGFGCIISSLVPSGHAVDLHRRRGGVTGRRERRVFLCQDIRSPEHDPHHGRGRVKNSTTRGHSDPPRSGSISPRSASKKGKTRDMKFCKTTRLEITIRDSSFGSAKFSNIELSRRSETGDANNREYVFESKRTPPIRLEVKKIQDKWQNTITYSADGREVKLQKTFKSDYSIIGGQNWKTVESDGPQKSAFVVLRDLQHYETTNTKRGTPKPLSSLGITERNLIFREYVKPIFPESEFRRAQSKLLESKKLSDMFGMLKKMDDMVKVSQRFNKFGTTPVYMHYSLDQKVDGITLMTMTLTRVYTLDMSKETKLFSWKVYLSIKVAGVKEPIILRCHVPNPKDLTRRARAAGPYWMVTVPKQWSKPDVDCFLLPLHIYAYDGRRTRQDSKMPLAPQFGTNEAPPAERVPIQSTSAAHTGHTSSDERTILNWAIASRKPGPNKDKPLTEKERNDAAEALNL